MSQRAVGALVGRSAVAVCDWEAGRSWPIDDAIPRIMEAFGCGVDLLQKVFGVDYDARIDGAAYVSGDPVEIDRAHFLRHRGKCLEVLTLRAQGGSVSHLSLFFDLMERTEMKALRSLSIRSGGKDPNPKILQERAKWLQQSLGSSSAPTPAPKPSSEDKNGSNGSKKETSGPSTDPDVQPSNIPGI
jgi:transcriptional regulator with XRE-family HTH domain